MLFAMVGAREGVCRPRSHPTRSLFNRPVPLPMLVSPTCLIRIMLAAALTTSTVMPDARAAEGDTLTLFADSALRHESNLFRLPPGVSPKVTDEDDKSDDIAVTTLGVRLDKRYSLQRFGLEASLVDHRYRNFDYLNFTARNYAAAWNWQITPRFTGVLRSDRTESLNSFSDYTDSTERNIRTDTTHRFEGIFEVDGAWRLLGGLARTERINSETFQEESDSRLDTVEAGVRRDAASGGSISLLLRQGRGEYLHRNTLSSTDQLDNAFEQREYELRAAWPLSAKTTLQGRLAHLSREHEHFSARDYAGPVGNLSLAWRATEKTLLTGTIARDLVPFQSSDSSYAASQRVNFNGLWRISKKTSLRGLYEVSRRDFRGSISPDTADDRRDTLRRAELGIEWQALRSLRLGASVTQEERASNRDDYDFTNTTGSVSARFTF